MKPHEYLFARPNLFSLGGGVLCGTLLITTVLAWSAWIQPGTSLIERWILGGIVCVLLGYLVESMSERLWVDAGHVHTDSFLRRRRIIPLQEVASIVHVHEGLNMARGIESVAFTLRDQRVHIFSLGPLWRQRDLERFFSALEERVRVLH
jgi:hypothetical protein